MLKRAFKIIFIFFDLGIADLKNVRRFAFHFRTTVLI